MMLGLLLHRAEHWETQHMPGQLFHLNTLMSPGQHPILDMGILFTVPTARVGCRGARVAAATCCPSRACLFSGEISLVRQGRLRPVLWREQGSSLDPSVKAQGRKGHISRSWAWEQLSTFALLQHFPLLQRGFAILWPLDAPRQGVR